MGSIIAFVMSQTGSFAVTIFVLFIIGLIIVGLVKLAKPFGWLKNLLGDLNGEPARPGFDARPGIMERQANTEKMLAQVLTVQGEHTEALKELAPNHGGSIKDHIRVLYERTNPVPNVTVNNTVNPPPEGGTE